MLRCLELATRGRGSVGNGALVGSVLVRRGVIIAESFHSEYGGAHAEAKLLESFPSSIEGDDILYVNLEPCCHEGKTPPCTNAILRHGIRTVVYGMRDPDPRVAGKGTLRLRQAGVIIRGGIDRALCERLNRGFISVRTQGRPWVTVKIAQTLAGEFATSDGLPLKISSREQDAWSHTYLRSQVDAILVGVQTILTDDPFLNTRFAHTKNMNNKNDHYSPLRVVLDPHLRIINDAKILTDELSSRTMIITSPLASTAERARNLEERGIRVAGVPMDGASFSLPELWKTLTTPGGSFYGITSLLVEGGLRTWDFFHQAGVVDEEVILQGSRATIR